MSASPMEPLEIGEISLSVHPPEPNYPTGMVWVRKSDGEGMGVHLKDFERMLLAWYEENF